MVKTNAMRILDSNKIDYKVMSYEVKSEHVDGVEVAHDIGRDVNEVYKTLVTQGVSKNIYVYVIPVHENLDLKKAAKVAKEKSVEMIHVKDINKLTGYKTFVNESAKNLDTIIVSAGKIGYQIELSPFDLQRLIKVEFVDVIKK